MGTSVSVVEPSHGQLAAPTGAQWGCVVTAARRVLIVAPGPSLAKLSLDRIAECAAAGVHIIAVNLAITWLPVAHSWVTVDPGTRTLPLMASRREGVTYYCAVPDNYGAPDAPVPNHRRPREPGIVYLRRLPNGSGLAEEPDALATGNSSFGALGLAYHMIRLAGGGGRVAMIGVDGTEAPYAFEVRRRPTRSLAHLPALFASALPQLQEAEITVFNGSPHSRIGCFRRGGPGAALKWLTDHAVSQPVDLQRMGWMP